MCQPTYNYPKHLYRCNVLFADLGFVTYNSTMTHTETLKQQYH